VKKPSEGTLTKTKTKKDEKKNFMISILVRKIVKKLMKTFLLFFDPGKSFVKSIEEEQKAIENLKPQI